MTKGTVSDWVQDKIMMELEDSTVLFPGVGPAEASPSLGGEIPLVEDPPLHEDYQITTALVLISTPLQDSRFFPLLPLVYLLCWKFHLLAISIGEKNVLAVSLAWLPD